MVTLSPKNKVRVEMDNFTAHQPIIFEKGTRKKHIEEYADVNHNCHLTPKESFSWLDFQ
jgi:hypothetical protein